VKLPDRRIDRVADVNRAGRRDRFPSAPRLQSLQLMKGALPRPVDGDLIADEVPARSGCHELERRPLQSLEAETEDVARYSCQ
jgi:hypothetical protein